MQSFLIEKIGAMTLFILFALFILKFIAFIYLQPYRNKLMVWYMKTFSKYYHAARKSYDEILQLQEACARNSVDICDGHYKFFECLMEHEKFRTSMGMMPGNIPVSHTTDDVSGKRNVFVRDYENFVAFFGKGKMLHKIEVMFNLEEEVRLLTVQLFYHEDYDPFFYHLLASKKFPPRSDSSKRKRKGPTPVPTRKFVPA